MTTPAENSQNQPPIDVAERAGRGGALVLFAKIFFILTGLVQQAALSRVLGRSGYGQLALVLAPANVVNNVVVAGATQGVSRAVAQSPGNEASALRQALRIHVPIAIVLALFFAGAAPLIANFQHAPEIRSPLFIMSGVVLMYGLYAPLVGSLNGRGLFGRQAGLDVLFAAVRTVLMVALAFALTRMGMGVIGVTIGFVLAAATIFTTATRVAGTGKKSETRVVSTKDYLGALLPLTAAQFFVNLVMQADIVLLGRFLVEAAAHSNLAGKMASIAADEHVAVYRACQLFAFLPYQLLLSLTQILFPMLAHARAANDPERVRRYVSRGARLGAIATGALVSVIAVSPRSLIQFLYEPAIAVEGEHTLRILALAQGTFAMLAIASTILASVGKERQAAGLTLLALVLSVAFCVVLVPRANFGEPQLLASASAVGVALVIALGIGAFLVTRAIGAFVPVRTAVRVLLALASTLALGTFIPPASRIYVPVVSFSALVWYFAFLLATREIIDSDFSPLVGTLRKRFRRSQS